jgi:hypothetical protein
VRNIILLIIFLFCVGFVVTGELLIRKGIIKRADTPDYRGVIRGTTYVLIVDLAIILVTYLLSSSMEVTISIAAILIAFTLASFILRILHELQNSRRKREGGW